MLIDMEIDGLVFISVGDSPDAFIRLAEAKHPVLVLDREVPLENADFVLTDNAQGVRLAVEYMLGLGHTKLGYIQGSMTTEPGRERFRSFIETCGGHNVKVCEKWTFQGDFLFGSGTRAGDRILALPSNERPTAVLAGNDLMAIGLMQRLQEHGIVVPRDMSVMGYDDISWASWVFPRLSTIRQDPLEIAREGARLLTERIDSAGVGSSDPRVVPIQPTLVRRNSCDKVENRNKQLE
jgi:LacI family transcriptional regulator